MCRINTEALLVADEPTRQQFGETLVTFLKEDSPGSLILREETFNSVCQTLLYF